MELNSFVNMNQLSLRVFLIIILFSISINTCNGASTEKEKLELSHYKEIAQIRLDGTRDLIQKDIQAVNSRLDTQDKRLDTQNSHIDQSLNLLGLILSVLGVALPLAGLVGYFSVSRKARREAQVEAQKEAKATVNLWFGDNANELRNRLDELQSKLQQLEGQAEADINSHIQRVQDGADLAIKEIQISVTAPHSYKANISEKASTALAKAAIAAKNKPESEYTFIDWNNRAFDAYRMGDKERAALFWRDAANDSAASPEQVALALSNAGSALSDLNRYEQAIEIFDEVISRFDRTNSKPVKEGVVSALNGKASCLSFINRNDEAGLLLDKIIERLKDNEELSNSDEMALAITNKIINLSIQEQNSEALNLCGEFIQRFDKTTDVRIISHLITVRGRKMALLWPLDKMEEAKSLYEMTLAQFGDFEDLEIKQEIVKLKNTMGFILLCQAKEKWLDGELRNNNLKRAMALFEEGVLEFPERYIILGNRAYCGFLLGGTEESAFAKLKYALSLGEQDLYTETLEDLKIHPVPEKDNFFRALLDKAWIEVQSFKKSKD